MNESVRRRISVLGVEFDNVTMDEAVSSALPHLSERNGAYVVTPNPEIVMVCRENAEAMAAVNGASLVIPDGIGVIYGARILKHPLKEKVPGIDFTEHILQSMAQNAQRLFLLGAKPGVAEKAGEKLCEKYPGLVLCGTNDGYFKDDAPVLEKINAASPDLLLVCLGAPKQELWMAKNAPDLSAGLMIGAGGSLDVFSGETQRAPAFWQKAGLEWLYRLLKEPSRFFRMLSIPKFLIRVVLERGK